MQERTCRKIKKSLHFEKGGETFSVEIGLENVSPEVSKRSLKDYLDSLYKSTLVEVIGRLEDCLKVQEL
jgi:hypothetical protein